MAKIIVDTDSVEYEFQCSGCGQHRTSRLPVLHAGKATCQQRRQKTGQKQGKSTVQNLRR